VGSHCYAQEAYARGDSIVGALNFDMIGYVDYAPESIDIIYNGFSVGLADAYEEAVGLYVPEMPVARHYSPGFASSDNASFWDYGYSSFCGIEDSDVPNPYYHTTSDRVSTLTFSFYRDVVGAGVACLAELARIDSVTASVPVAEAEAEFRVGPNPASGEIAIEMAASAKKGEAIGVYDVSGRLVKTLQPAVSDGMAKAVWQSDDASGAKVSPGIYFFRAQGSERSTKVVVVR
jgi:Zn-dependent M28 family amino/carboxypeptidase